MRSKADTHVHTFYSGVSNFKALRFPESVISPEVQVDRARKDGYSVVCITDHDATAGAFRAVEYAKRFDDIDAVVGEEIMTADGEVIGLWLNEQVPPGLPIEETIDIIRSQGGITIAPHPFSFYVNALRDRVFDTDLDGIEVINGGHVDEYTNHHAQEVFDANPGRWAAIAASDAHSTRTAGYCWTEFDGQGEDDLMKAIKNKTTVACGVPAPVFTEVQWSIEVVLGGQRMLSKALVNKLRPDPENPLITKMLTINDMKKIGGIIGGFLYLVPPMPFIATWLSTSWLKKKANKLLGEVEDFIDDE